MWVLGYRKAKTKMISPSPPSRIFHILHQGNSRWVHLILSSTRPPQSDIDRVPHPVPWPHLATPACMVLQCPGSIQDTLCQPPTYRSLVPYNSFSAQPDPAHLVPWSSPMSLVWSSTPHTSPNVQTYLQTPGFHQNAHLPWQPSTLCPPDLFHPQTFLMLRANMTCTSCVLHQPSLSISEKEVTKAAHMPRSHSKNTNNMEKTRHGI